MKDGTMSDTPNIKRPLPERETMVPSEGIEQRSAGQVAVQAVEQIASGAEWTAGALAVTGAAMKLKGALGSKGDDGPKANDSDPED
jgi:hypothetical protein